jgi:hypothetical protein
MKKETQQLERRGLPGGPNETFTYTTGVFSTEGFRMDSPDVNNYQNIIPSGSISMKERDGSPLRKGPIHGVDNLGYEQIMYPGFDYQFPGTEVTETLMAKMGGALLDKTIKCGNCGWEWKAADGGSDLYNCHKCKGGKGLIKAQKGIEKKPKLGAGKYYTTTGKVVDWGTPEYERAYNRGEVLSEDGVRSEVTLEGGVLPEIVIPNNYKNNFWENYRDKIIEEGEDSGVLGAIMGVPINAITSLPQLALMNKLTGKVQRPSTAWGFENNEGWFDSPSSFGKNLSNFALDAVTDPSDWVGVGELTTVGRLAKSKLRKTFPGSISPELREGLRTNGLTFNGTPRKYPINSYQRAVTEDIDRLFEEFPELAKIGSKEDYIKHLETIHPETTQPGIFYRGSKNPNLNPFEWTPNPSGGNNLGEGFYFTPDPFKSEKYGKEAKALLNIKDPTYTSVKLNMHGLSVPKGMKTKDLVGEGSAAISIENPNRDLFTELGTRAEGYMRKYIGDLDEQGFPVATRPYDTNPNFIDYSKIDEIAVPDNSQIHVLGSDADKELFKNYINKLKQKEGGEPPITQEGIEYFNQVKDWYDKYTTSPLYRENLIKSGYKDPQAIIDQRLANINKTKFEHDENRLGTYYNNRSKIIHYSPIKDIQNWEGNAPENDDILAHEFGHSSIDKSKNFLQGFTPNYNEYDYEQLIKRNKGLKTKGFAHENYADLKAIQYEAEKQGLYKAGYDEFTEEILDKLKDSGLKKRLLNNFSKKDIIWFQNNLAQNDDQYQLPIAQVGTETTYPWSPGSKSKGTGDFLTNFKNYQKNAQKLEAALDKVKAKFPSIQPQPKDEVSTREVFTATNDNILNASNEGAKIAEQFDKQQKYEANVKANQAIAQRTAQRQFNALPKEEQERILQEQYAQKYGTITQGDEPDSKLSKFAQSLVFPMTALKDLYWDGRVRDDLISSVWNNPKTANPYDVAYLGGLAYLAAPFIQSGVTAAGSVIAPYLAADAVIGGTTLTGVNLGNIAAAGFAGHGLSKVGPDATKFADRPSWENLGNIAWDVADIVPIAGPAMKTMGEGVSAIGKGFNSLRNMPTSIAPELRQGLRTAGPSFGSTVDVTGNISKNLEDLNYAKDWAKQYGYTLPENFQRIAQSDVLTDRTLRGLANRHNTFVRGVSTNWEVLGQKNPEIIKHLEGKGFNLGTEEGSKAAAEYMATHIPFDTGYGRFGLKEGEHALYLSNSVPAGEGYTYGSGYVVKAKRPTDFSSANRQDWLTANDFDAHLGFKGSPFGQGIVKNDYIKRFPTNFRETLAITGDPAKMTELQNAVKEKEILYNDLAYASWKKHNNLISDLKYRTDANYRNNIISDDPFVRDVPNVFDQMHLNLLESKRDFMQNYYRALPFKDIVKGVYGDADVWKAFGKNLFGKLDPFSHYAIKGQEGEKVLEALRSTKVTPDIWQNTSRAHINKYTDKLSRRQEGGESMFKSPSIVDVDYVEPTYSYPVRKKLYPGEDKFFKENPHVTGMAAEDNQVIINPYSSLSDAMKELVRINETARLAMKNGYPKPTFDLTPEQQEYFNTMNNGKPYSTDEQDIRETIIGRILSGDSSAGDITPEQKKYAERLQKVLKLQVGGESKQGSLMQAYNRLPKQKKMGGAIANKKQFGGQLNSGNITMYRDYIKGTIGNETEAIKNYDKLNRIYYSKAKELGMTAANYIMTYIAGNS